MQRSLSAKWSRVTGKLLVYHVCIIPGAAYSQAEDCIHDFVIGHGFPFLPTPMGKGVIPDTHPNCVAAARSR